VESKSPHLFHKKRLHKPVMGRGPLPLFSRKFRFCIKIIKYKFKISIFFLNKKFSVSGMYNFSKTNFLNIFWMRILRPLICITLKSGYNTSGNIFREISP
jgi:hypothetical protein